MTDNKNSILFLTTSTEGGGAEKVFRLLVDYWLGKDIFDGQVVCLRTPASSVWRKDQVTYLGWRSHYDYPKAVLRLAHLLRKHSFDCIFSFTVFANVVACWARRLSGKRIPLIMNARNLTFSLLSLHDKDIRTFFLQKLVHDTYRSADFVLCNSENTANELIHYFNLDPTRVRTVVNPIDVQETMKFSRPFKERTSATVKIVAAARLVEKKGLDVLLKAISILPEKDRLFVIIAGSGPDAEKLRLLVHRLKINDHVRFIGWQQNPLPLLASSDIITITSRYEGLPNVLLEGMALGKPIIATDCAPIISRIAAQNACLKIPCNSPEHLANAIQQLITDDTLRNQLAKNALEVVHKFDVPIAIQGYENTIRQLIEAYRKNRFHPRTSVAYVLRRYPTLSETFISSEIRFLHKSGYTISVLSLLNDNLVIKSSEDDGIPIKRYSYHKPSHWKHLISQCIRHPVWLFKSILFSFTIAFIAPDQFIRLLVLTPKLVAFTGYCRNHGITHIHSHFSGLASLAGQVVADLLKLPFTFMFHTIVELHSPLFPIHIRQAEHILVNSRINKDSLLHLWSKVESDKVKVVRSGLGLQIKNSSDEPDNESKDIDILSVGRLVPKKGFHLLLEALYILKKKDIKFTCTILGDGQEKRHLEILIEKFRLWNTTLKGSVSNPSVYRYLKRSKIFVLPCRKLPDQEDGLPVVITEALANGIPVISCDVGGISEVVINNKTGLLIPQNDPERLAEGILFLLTNDAIRHKMGQNGIRLIQWEFNKHRILEQLITLFSLEKNNATKDGIHG